MRRGADREERRDEDEDEGGEKILSNIQRRERERASSLRQSVSAENSIGSARGEWKLVRGMKVEVE